MFAQQTSLSGGRSGQRVVAPAAPMPRLQFCEPSRADPGEGERERGRIASFKMQKGPSWLMPTKAVVG